MDAVDRAAINRRVLLDQRQQELQRERQKKLQEGELREAFSEIRRVAEAMKQTRAFELRQSTLGGWADQLLGRVQVLEGHVAALVRPPTPPSNTLDTIHCEADDQQPPEKPESTIAAHVAPVQGALYLLLEAVSDRLRAERATLYQHQVRTGELQGVCVVNTGRTKPCREKTPVGLGWAGQVFSTGIAANVSHVYSDARYDINQDKKLGYRNRSLLLFPTSGVGVVQVANKNRGTALFDADDESMLGQFADLFGYILSKYPVDSLAPPFDPALLHRSASPFRPHPPQNMALSVQRVKKLVYRAHQSGHSVVQKAVVKEGDASGVKQQPTIEEVDAHIKSVEESWMKSVGLNVEYEKESEAALQRLRSLRDVVKQKQRAQRQAAAALAAKEQELLQLLQHRCPHCVTSTPSAASALGRPGPVPPSPADKGFRQHSRTQPVSTNRLTPA